VVGSDSAGGVRIVIDLGASVDSGSYGISGVGSLSFSSSLGVRSSGILVLHKCWSIGSVSVFLLVLVHLVVILVLLIGRSFLDSGSAGGVISGELVLLVIGNCVRERLISFLC